MSADRPNPYLQRLAHKIVDGISLLVRDTALRERLCQMTLLSYREVRDDFAGEQISREEAPPEVRETHEQIEVEPVFGG